MFASLESFSSTDAGCDQCADLNTAFGSTVQNVNNAVSQYAQGAQMMNNQQQQYHNNVMNSNSVGLNQNTTQLNNALNNLPNPVSTGNNMMHNNQQSNGQVAMQKMVQKAVAQPNVNSGRVPTGPVNTQNNNNKQTEVVVEAFEQPEQVQVNIPSRLILINLAFVVIVALSVNEAFKYYINRSLQMADGTPHYYAFYAIGAVLIAIGAHYVSTRMN
jgi:hypothetical protein